MSWAGWLLFWHALSLLRAAITVPSHHPSRPPSWTVFELLTIAIATLATVRTSDRKSPEDFELA